MQNLGEFEIKLYSTDDVCRLLHIGKQNAYNYFIKMNFQVLKLAENFG